MYTIKINLHYNAFIYTYTYIDQELPRILQCRPGVQQRIMVRDERR